MKKFKNLRLKKLMKKIYKRKMKNKKKSYN